ncbi:hypothetical protein GYB59_06275 [bacterium]|nr:hypothetical protein [Planctomyces sp.]MBR9801315.1 hypothetical protein [bacterium]
MATATLKTGEIIADASYSLQEFKERTGMGRAAMQQARRKGLVVRRAHKRGYVLGRDWINYLAQQPVDSEQ